MIKIAFRNIIKKFSLTLTTIVSLTVTLFVIAFMCSAYLNVNHLSKKIDQSFKVVVSVQPQYDKKKDAAKYDKIETEILKIKNVSGYKFSSKSQELSTLFDGDLGKQLTSNLNGENPLSDTYYVSVKSEKDLASVTSQIKLINGIDTATYGGDVIKSVITKLHTWENFMIIIIGASIVIAGLLIMNILRVAIINSKDGIEIMRLVGASNNYIRGPYIVEAIIVTTISAVLSTLALYFTLKGVYSIFDNITIADLKLDVFNNVFLISTGISVVGGLLISVLSSIITIRRFIKI